MCRCQKHPFTEQILKMDVPLADLVQDPAETMKKNSTN